MLSSSPGFLVTRPLPFGKCLFRYLAHLKNWVVCVFIVCFSVLFTYAEHKSFIRACTVNFFPVSGLPNHFLFSFFFFFGLSSAARKAHGGSQARGLMRATAAGLRQSHSNSGSEPRLRPPSQLTATPDPSPTEPGQGSNLHPRGTH